jgi:choline dehydrogenase-like flavoprotein
MNIAETSTLTAVTVNLFMSQSPKVLQLSGIGDAASLSSLGIKSIVDLPTVGKNFQGQVSLLK